MENNNNFVQKAVDQCIEIDKSLDNCLRALQMIGAPNVSESLMVTPTITRRNLCGKRSYTVCIGKKYPELQDIDGTEDSNLNNTLMQLFTFEQVALKFKNILETQEHVLQRMERMLKSELVKKNLLSTEYLSQ